MNEITKLRVGDEDFLVASTIERCPKTMMLRELVKNALEAVGQAKADGQRTEITAVTIDGVRKLRIWNTGPGLDAEELFRMCDIASSIGKLQRLDANFGMGAKVATLPSNHLGVRYRSCTGGRVHEVVIGKRNGVYGRVLRSDPTTGNPVAVVDVTAEVQAAGVDTMTDWTEVTLLGNRPSQDTVADPYDGNPRVPRAWALRHLQQRFFRISGNVQIVLGPDVHGGKELRPFVPLAGHMAERFERYEAVPIQDGIIVHFGYDPAHPKLPNHNASYVDGLSPDVSFAGLLYDDEFYDFRTDLRWTQEAPSFGIGFGARHLSIVVELPSGYPVNSEGYRQFLRYRNGSQDQVRLNDFAAMVRSSRPNWVRELVRNLAPDSGLISNVEEQLKNLIAELGLKRRRPRVRRPPVIPPGVMLVEGSMAPGTSSPPQRATTSSSTETTQPREHAAGVNAAAPPRQLPREKTDVEGVPEGMVEEMEALPALLLLRSEEEIADRNLAHRAGRFYADTHQLYINMRYPTVSKLVELLVADTPADVSIDVAREVAERVAESMLVLRLGRALILGLAKRNAEKGWNETEKLTAVSSEMLTVVADDLPLLLPQAREIFVQRLPASSAVRQAVLSNS